MSADESAGLAKFVSSVVPLSRWGDAPEAVRYLIEDRPFRSRIDAGIGRLGSIFGPERAASGYNAVKDFPVFSVDTQRDSRRAYLLFGAESASYST